MKKLKIKISDNLKNILNNDEVKDLIEIVKNNHDLLITKDIPDNPDGLFIVIWDIYDVSEIEKKKIISFENTKHRYLRGIFLKNDIESGSRTFIETLKEIKDEVNLRDDLNQKAKDIKKSKNEYISIGSLVKNVKEGGFEDAYGQPRFTTLFTDKPMLKLILNLLRIIEEIKPSIVKLNNHYRDYISQIKKTGGIVKNKEEFNKDLIKRLQECKNTCPVSIPPILLTGETGVGKTLIARWIHEKICKFYSSPNYEGNFKEVNSSGLSPNLLESDLFGHVKGAWTDAKNVKPGRALLAIGGVLFLDEIGDIHPEVQPKIMKFIEEKTFIPEGWTGEEFYTPLLVVAATNKNLEEEVKKGRFRKDLYSRFRYRIHVPSIEERKASLHIIIDLILQEYGVKKKGIKCISKEAIKKLKEIKYEENWRGLERIVMDAAYKTLDFELDIILPEVVEEVTKNI